jgi:hypothetical protein
MLLHVQAYGQKLPVDSMYATIKQFNAHAKGANWDIIDSSYRDALLQARNSTDSIYAIVDVFEALDDVHSTIQMQGQTFGYYHAVSPEASANLQPLLQRQREQTGKIFDTIFPEHIAYIRIPTLYVWGDEVNTYTRAIQDALCRIIDKETKGCIVDLRLNGGGNMYPMLAGLFPLLGNNELIHTTYADSTVQYTWLLKKGNLYAMNADGEKVPVTNGHTDCQEMYDKLKVMVLLGPCTMSSGQATAVAFYKRPNTLFIGEPSAPGYTTANTYYSFSQGITLNMASGFISDREGEIYPEIVNPQLYVIGGDNFDDLSKDLKVMLSRWRIEDK